ncbi:helix-turn-helix domain-containing protein [Actinacidiphila alni]|uniref:helix-turn-helix domain-containing protein n=1 Tax=Actinacidiphila alni TaxID=380248 RepID=UPI0015A55AF4
MTPNGPLIRAIRRSQNLSLRGLARATERQPSHISRLERGQCGASDDTVGRIATALRVPVDAIVIPLTEESP